MGGARAPSGSSLWYGSSAARSRCDSIFAITRGSSMLRSSSDSRVPRTQRGRSGPLYVGFQRYADPNTRRFPTAREQVGIAEIGDINLASGQAVGLTHVNMHRGRRWSVYDGYLRPALRRANLELRTGCMAHRVILEGSRCRGVE